MTIPILPVICDKNYTQQQAGTGDKDPAKWPSSWLGALIAGKVYVDFRDRTPEGRVRWDGGTATTRRYRSGATFYDMYSWFFLT